METNILMIIAAILILLIIAKKCARSLPLLSLDSRSSDMPYAKCSLLTRTEQSFCSILIREAQKRNLHVCPKVRLEDIICVTDKENRNKYRGYIKSRHVDFVLIDKYYQTVAAIELDDPSHNTKKAAEIDAFKNELFETVEIPLIRIDVKDNYSRELNYAFDELQIPIITSSGANYRS